MRVAGDGPGRLRSDEPECIRFGAAESLAAAISALAKQWYAADETELLRGLNDPLVPRAYHRATLEGYLTH